ncbi:hypothetical protein [Rhodoferax sp.]|uniref:hypothetical protein n=1 Tax=Rhodoferax sp. TaxID=50421 RepID=UPI00274CE57C|nr:hypothetical protein [Rhodoferax sp.]
MTTLTPQRGIGIGIWAMSLVAAGFGLATIKEGGTVLFGDQAARDAAGNYMLIVVWFNFLAGFAYLVAAVGLARQRAWAARLALGIATATGLMFCYFGMVALSGIPYELRTVAAMTLRTTLWVGIAWVAGRPARRSSATCLGL